MQHLILCFLLLTLATSLRANDPIRLPPTCPQALVRDVTFSHYDWNPSDLAFALNPVKTRLFTHYHFEVLYKKVPIHHYVLKKFFFAKVSSLFLAVDILNRRLQNATELNTLIRINFDGLNLLLQYANLVWPSASSNQAIKFIDHPKNQGIWVPFSDLSVAGEFLILGKLPLNIPVSRSKGMNEWLLAQEGANRFREVFLSFKSGNGFLPEPTVSISQLK